MKRLVRLERWLCLTGLAVAGILLSVLVLLSGLNVLGRLGGHPISGSYELSGFLGALIAALALADTQRKRGHVDCAEHEAGNGRRVLWRAYRGRLAGR